MVNIEKQMILYLFLFQFFYISIVIIYWSPRALEQNLFDLISFDFVFQLNTPHFIVLKFIKRHIYSIGYFLLSQNSSRGEYKTYFLWLMYDKHILICNLLSLACNMQSPRTGHYGLLLLCCHAPTDFSLRSSQLDSGTSHVRT